jgi:hypothetical protein
MPSSPTGSKLSPKAKKQSKATKPRPIARPHKRLPDEKLVTRIVELTKKLQVLDAKTTLLRDRLEVYQKEKQTRADVDTNNTSVPA